MQMVSSDFLFKKVLQLLFSYVSQYHFSPFFSGH